MTLIKDEYWNGANQAPPTGDLTTTSLAPESTENGLTLNKTWRHPKQILPNVTECVRRYLSNSIRVQLFLAIVSGPCLASVLLIAFGDLAAPQWIFAVFTVASVIGFWTTALVTKQSLQPLTDFANAANELGISGAAKRLPEYSAHEATAAARAFNAMAERVNRQVEERIRLLTAFSHDMQTPITRMRLRVELADQFPEREKILRDLSEAENLVRNGIAFARNSHITRETDIPIDIRSFVESLVFDYQDTGRKVRLCGVIDGVRVVKPGALRRILSNFIDNALKFAGSAEIDVSETSRGDTVIAVRDRGPGIASDQIEAAVKPFVKLQHGSNLEAPGVGLGLAIAKHLAHEMNATVVLENRDGGGLSAQIVFAPR